MENRNRFMYKGVALSLLAAAGCVAAPPSVPLAVPAGRATEVDGLLGPQPTAASKESRQQQLPTYHLELFGFVYDTTGTPRIASADCEEIAGGAGLLDCNFIVRSPAQAMSFGSEENGGICGQRMSILQGVVLSVPHTQNPRYTFIPTHALFNNKQMGTLEALDSYCSHKGSLSHNTSPKDARRPVSGEERSFVRNRGAGWNPGRN